MTLKEIVYNIQNLLSKGHQTDDNKLSDRQVAFIVDYMRAYLLKQDREKDKHYDRDIFQNLSPIKMTPVPETDNCFLNNDCVVLKSNIKLPKYIKLLSVKTLKGVPIEKSNWSRVYWNQYEKFTSNRVVYFIKDGYLYVTNLKGIVFVQMFGLFENPTTVLINNKYLCDQCPDCGDCGNCPEDYLDMEYPISSELLHRMIGLLKNNELNILLSVPQDTLNNATQIDSQ